MTLNSYLDSKIEQLEGSQGTDFFSQFKNLTFSEFWDKIGQPVKKGKGKGVLEYEFELFNLLGSNRSGNN